MCLLDNILSNSENDFAQFEAIIMKLEFLNSFIFIELNGWERSMWNKSESIAEWGRVTAGNWRKCQCLLKVFIKTSLITIRHVIAVS